MVRLQIPNAGGAKQLIQDIKYFVSTKEYVAQVFKCYETGLFWENMPRWKKKEKSQKRSLSGHKSMKDRLTLMFCENANRTVNLNP